jgi:hypothetical protein
MPNNKKADLLDQLIVESGEIYNALDNDDDMTHDQIVNALKAQINMIDKLETITNGPASIS